LVSSEVRGNQPPFVQFLLTPSRPHFYCLPAAQLQTARPQLRHEHKDVSIRPNGVRVHAGYEDLIQSALPLVLQIIEVAPAFPGQVEVVVGIDAA